MIWQEYYNLLLQNEIKMAMLEFRWLRCSQAFLLNRILLTFTLNLIGKRWRTKCLEWLESMLSNQLWFISYLAKKIPEHVILQKVSWKWLKNGRKITDFFLLPVLTKYQKRGPDLHCFLRRFLQHHVRFVTFPLSLSLNYHVTYC